MDLFLQQLSNGLVIGSTYAVVAVGFALGYGQDVKSRLGTQSAGKGAQDGDGSGDVIHGGTSL